jgi:hypothetical protein
MNRFDPVPEPGGFDKRARVPGNRWIASNPAANRPRDYWSRFKGDLAAGFHYLCAYSAMYEPVGTVDHFVSWLPVWRVEFRRIEEESTVDRCCRGAGRLLIGRRRRF